MTICRPHGTHHRPRYGDPIPAAAWERTQDQRRESSQSSFSTFDEVESLDLSRSRSQSTESSLASRAGSRNSLSPSGRGSRSQSFDMDAMASLDKAALERGMSAEPPHRDPYTIMQGAFSRLSGRSDAVQHNDYITSALARYAMMEKHYSVDRQSSRSTGSRTSRTNSSWDEVESLDLGGQHEVDLDPSFFLEMDRYSHLDQYTTKGANYWSNASSPKSRSRSNSNSMKKRSNGEHTSANTTDSLSNHDDNRDRRRRGRDLIVPDREEDEPSSRRSHLVRRSESTDRESTSSDRSENIKGWAMGNGKSAVEQLLRYKLNGNSGSSPDSVSIASSYPNSHGSGELAGKLPYENEYEYYVRMRRVSQDSVASGFSGPRSGLGSRTMSMESSSSSFESVQPEFSAYAGGGNMPGLGRNAARAAEDVLMNLGFVGQDSFIPERFARNWYDKVQVARRKQMEAYQQQEIADMLEGLETSSRGHSGRSSPLRRHGSKSEFLHKLDINSRNASMRRSRFRRAATMLTYHEGSNKVNKAKILSQRSFEKEGSMEKQDSIDQLKFVLERQASILNTGMDHRRKQFAGTRQKSLPLCLETLSEEDEGRSSKGTSFDKGRMKSFLEEEERMSRSSSKDSLKGKHSDSVGSESSAVPNSCSTTSAEGSDQEGDVENIRKIDKFKVEARKNLPSNSSDSSPAMSFSQVIPQNNFGAFGGTIRSVMPVMPLLQRQSSLDNIQLGSYPQLIAPSMSMISEEHSRPPLTYQTALPVRAEVTKSMSVPLPPAIPVPSIVVSSHKFLPTQSSSSLEVADIFDRRTSQGSNDSISEDEPIPGGGTGSRRGSSERNSPKPPALKVEPAMFSVNAVSLDVEDPPLGGERRSSVASMLLAPSPSNSMLTSPIPVSPVTVIEADHLDNQDSMDSSDSASHTGGDNPLLLVTPDGPDSLHPIAEEEVHSSDQSRSTSFDDASYLSDTAFSRYSSTKNSFDEQTPSLKDSGIIADDGKLSPIAMFPNNVTFTSHLDAETLKEAMNSRSDSFQSAQESIASSDERRMRKMSVEESQGTMSPRDMRDVCVQEDDGTLSPIMFNPTLYDADYQLTEDVFFASDKGIQYSADWDENGNNNDSSNVEKITTASQTIFRWQGQSDTSYNRSYISSEDNFEPMSYYLNTSCQTDITGDSNNNPENNNSPETVMVKFQSIPHFQMLCNHCQKSIQMSTSLTSVDMPINSPLSLSLDLNKKSLSTVSKDSLDVIWRSRDGVDSSSGKKTLDTIIERLSKKTNLIRQRSRSKSSSFDSYRHNDILNDINDNDNTEETNKVTIIKNTGSAVISNEEERKRKFSSGSSKKRLPKTPTYMRSTSDNFEHRRSEHVASTLADENTGVVNNRSSKFVDSRNSSASGSVSAPASQNVSRNMSVDSRRSSTGAGTSGSRRGSLVRQHCIELSTVLMNMQDIDSRDLESGSEDEDVFIASRSRNHYSEEFRRNKKTLPLASQADLENTVTHNRAPVQYQPHIQQKPLYSHGYHDNYSFDFDRMPSRFKRENSSRVRVQKKSKLKTKHPHLSSRSSSSLNTLSTISSKDSLERDQLASSIATDLFQHIGIKSGLNRRQILDEIAMDYLVMKAVNRTLDQLFSSGELSDPPVPTPAPKHAPLKVPTRKTSGASADEKSSAHMTSFDSSDTNSEVSHRGRDDFLNSAQETGEAFSTLSTCDDDDGDANLYLSQFNTSHLLRHASNGKISQRGDHDGRTDYNKGSQTFRMSLETEKTRIDNNNRSKPSSVSSQDGENNCCLLFVSFLLLDIVFYSH